MNELIDTLEQLIDDNSIGDILKAILFKSKTLGDYWKGY